MREGHEGRIAWQAISLVVIFNGQGMKGGTAEWTGSSGVLLESRIEGLRIGT